MNTAPAVLLTVRVGWTSQRPVIPDQHMSWVTIGANDTPTSVQDSLVAAQQMVSTHAVMVTSSALEEVEL